MPNRLPIPEELAHLIEKRGEGDRRTKENRTSDVVVPSDQTTAGTTSSSVAEAEIQSTTNSNSERRATGRRTSDR